MDWKTNLDKWLTTPPEDEFDNWCERVLELLSDSFFEENEEWILEDSGVCNKWLNELYREGYEPILAAIEIEKRKRNEVERNI